jgi:hypothetical protein
MRKKTGRNGSRQTTPYIAGGAVGIGSSGRSASPAASAKLSAHPSDDALGVLDSPRGAVRLAQIRIGKITLKVLFATMPIDAPDPAFGD